MPTTKRQVPLGKALRFSDAELTELAYAGPKETSALAARGNALWRQYAPAGWETLLDAQPIERPDRTVSDFAWDAERRRYFDLRTQRAISPRTVRMVIDAYLDAMSKPTGAPR